MKSILLLLLATVLLISCGDQEANLEFERQGRNVPSFDSDNAYNFIDEQVSLGPRVPNSEAHVQAKDYLRSELEASAGENSVFVQEFQQVVYGDTLTMFNILAGFGLQHQDRILLAAHWDSRPRAENDSLDSGSPILGADDGGSGVGVLLELAQIFKENDVPIGVDIILFDGEDYGEVSDLDNYFLGARHWSNNPPVPGYNPRFGILLDMVGGEDAVFYKESYSMRSAPNLVNEIWQIAEIKGYSDLFINKRGGAVADDHIIVQQQAGINMINIIHHSVNENGSVQFPPYWHTQNDTMEIIDRTTLQAVGDVLLELIYNRIPR
ncbi:M28 family peptidase [Rhodohalobacter sp. 8-1]|uniref:M28 family peptidase n=1 Tax=Rhodohalobacter sp. 8-1 TaxID=3131972 RepID=UPI0030EEA7A5